MAAIGAGAWWQLGPQTGFDGGGGGAIDALRTAAAERGKLERTIRLTGSTSAEKFVSITSPRLRGSRSRRGSSFSGGAIGVKSGILVSSTSSVASVSLMSSLSQTGSVTSSSGAASRGGGLSGGGGSSALQAATSRVSSGGSGAGNITTTGGAGSSAMGSGIGSTSTSLTGGGGGGGRRRGDFHLALQKLAPGGTRVRKGDVVAEFDRQFMQTRLDDYGASVAQHEANLRKSHAEVTVTKTAHDESIKVAKSGVEKAELDVQSIPVMSAIQAERTKLALEEAKAEYDQLLSEVRYKRISEAAELMESELDLKEAKVELRRTEANADRLLVKAPIDGMVVLLSVFRNGEMGQVKEGDELYSGQPFIQVVDTSSMVVNAKVNQIDVEKLRIGQKAVVRFDAFPGLELSARVYSIGTVAKARQYRREYVTEIPVKLKLAELDDRVIPDLTVAADVVLETEDEVTMVPVASVFTDEGDNTPYVFVKTESGWERRDVELGLRSNVSVALRSGVAPGEEVAAERPAAPMETN